MANGFYGSLSKIQKINFQFDRVFPNRATMDAEAGTTALDLDGNQLECVLNGRYVLVDYNEGETVNVSLKLGYKQDDKIFANYNIPFSHEMIEENDKVIVIGEFDLEGEYTKYDDEEIWKCSGFESINNEASEDTIAVFTKITDWNTAIVNSDSSVYQKNLILDNTTYPNAGRGWDSTVWQKTYQGGKAKYIMVAELNAISPTLAIAPGAPSSDGIPNNPYFIDSTPNFYRLHLESNWGLRLKGAKPYTGKVWSHEKSQLLPVKYSANDISDYYPSDVTGTFKKVSGNDNWPLAIFYNKRGFNKFTRADDGYKVFEDYLESKVLPSQNIEEDAQLPQPILDINRWRKLKENKGKDFIDLTPTGLSGKLYENATGDGTTSAAVDMMEFTMMLPSLGEAISKVWDVVYGEDQEFDSNGFHIYYNNPENIDPDNVRDNFSSSTNKYRNIDTFWNSTNGIRANTDSGYNLRNLSSLAGTINSVHDLMGMIIRNYPDLSLINGVENWDPTKIYYKDGEYYIKNKEYKWEDYDDMAANAPRPLYNTISPQNMVGYGYTGSSESNVVPVELYRESWEEYPIIEDALSDNLDWYNNLYQTNKYCNYIKVKSPADIIDGAIYGTIEVRNASESMVNPPAGKIYYYYDTNGGEPVYKLHSSEAWDKGAYYGFTQNEINESEINAFFYRPDKFYAENLLTEDIHLATEGSLNELLGTNTTLADWKFYLVDTAHISKQYTYFPIYKKDANNNYIPVLTYISSDELAAAGATATYNAGTQVLTISLPNGYGQEIIPFEYINGVGTVVLSENNEVVGYWGKKYQATDENYYSLLFIASSELELAKENGQNIVEYQVDRYERRSKSFTFDSTHPVNVIEFEENTYYFKVGDDFYLEKATNLIPNASDGSIGGGGNPGYGYYKLKFDAEHRVLVRQSSGDYYRTADGDYLFHYAPHIPDPNAPQALFVTFTKLNTDYKVFIENTYYIDSQLTQKAQTYSPTATYYERIGNIVGNSEPDWTTGSLWDEEVIPEGMHLGQVTVEWKPKKLEEFSTGLTTLHGLLVQLYRKLQTGDKYSRDGNTLQGMLNQCKDVLKTLENRGYSYHSVEVENKNGGTDTLNAQSASATIKLKSNTHTIELSTNDDNISLDLSEQYRKWVVPSGDTNGSNLIFKDNDGNQNISINVANNKAVTVSQIQDNAAWVVVYNDSYTAEGIDFSSLIIRYNPQSNLFSVTATEQSSSSQHYNFSIIANTSVVSITRSIVEDYVPGSGEQIGDPFNGNMPPALNYAFYCASTEESSSDNLIISGWIKPSASTAGGTILTVDANKVVNTAELPTYNNKPLAYSETSAAISFGWDSTNQIFTIYSDGNPILQIRKQED